MNKKSITLFKKVCAVITSVCFMFTIIGNNLFAAVNVDTLQSKKQYFETKNENNLNSLFSSKYGKIVSYNDNSSDTVIINIQDLHCDYSVQKNIYYLIDEISKKYNIDKVYVEGGIGNIDTSFFANINSQYKQDVLEKMLKDGKLTGTEYYSAVTGKVNLLKGIEKKNVYLKNIVRLNDIIKSKKEISVYLSKIENEIDLLKSKYLKSKNKEFDKLLKQSEKKEISQEQFIIGLFNYAKNNNISLKNYENLQIYLSLFNYSVNNKKVQKELVALLKDIKQSLSYREYNNLINLTSNLTDIQKLGVFARKFCDENNINLNKSYPDLNKVFELKEKSVKCNPVELVKEERKLVDVLRTYLSDTETELEIAYLSDFEHFYKDYLSASLTASQWEYVKLGLDKFKELYAKYSISNDIDKLEKYSNLLTEFYDVNTERNKIFIQKMGLSTKSVSPIHPFTHSSDIFSKAKNIIVLVAGGYHTDGINDILNKKGYSNITITPNIANSTQESRMEYEYLAQKQAMSIRQMIALGLISNATPKDQILSVAATLLKNQNLDGININILVQQLNQLFSQDITISLMEEGKQLEITFEDGSTQIIDVEEDIVKLIREQDMQQLPARPLVQVPTERLENILNTVAGAVTKTTLNYGTGIVVPQVYQISKDVCLFMVENKLYLGNGAVWEIANSEYNGQTLDGVEPVVYEYMPEFMQRAMLSKQQRTDRNRKMSFRSVIKRIVPFILAVAVTISLIACNLVKPIDSNKVYEPYGIETIELSNEQRRFNSEIEGLLEEYRAGNGAYKSFVYNLINDSLPLIPAAGDDKRALINIENLYDQALVALAYMQMGNTYEAAEILSAIDSNGGLYMSNLENRQKTGEIVWVGIAAVQYKLLTGDTRFDGLIEKVDAYINKVHRSEGFYYGELSNRYVSTEHMFDIIAYFNLRSLLYGEEESTKKEENEALLIEAAEYLYSNLYNSETGSLKRGANDTFQALDTYSWGIQVLLSIKEVNPEIYENSSLSEIDIERLLEYVENNFVADVEYKGTKYENLYRWSNEQDSPVSFEWTMQMAIAYEMLGNEYKADLIMRDVDTYSKAMGFGNHIPYSDTNGVYNYTSNGWKVFAVPAICTSVGQRVQYEYGTFFLPITRIEGADYGIDVSNEQRLYFVKQDGTNWRTYGAQETVNLLDAKSIEIELELLNDVPNACVQLQLLTYDDENRQNLEGTSFGLYDQKYYFDSDGKLKINLDMRDFLGTETYETPEMITTNLEYIKLIVIAGKTSFGEVINTKSLDLDVKKVTITYVDGTSKVYTLLGTPTYSQSEYASDQPTTSILPNTIQKINDMISGGIFSIKKALLEIINEETFKSFFRPVNFVNEHINTKGAKILTIATAITFLVAFGMSMLALYGAYSLIVQAALSLAASLLAAFDVNVGTHIIIDYRYLKSVGLAEAVKLYGKENVKVLKDGNLSINDKEKTVPIYVINDKPKNAADFNFKSVPVKVRTQDGRTVKCWIGNYNGATVLFADGANYETIVRDFGKTRQFETVFGKKTALKANVDVIEIDMNNPDSGLNYSQSGNIIVGANMVKTENTIDLQKEISLLKNRAIEAVTINQNVAVYIDDAPETVSVSQDFINTVNLYVKNDNLGTNVKILFSNNYINKILELLEQELGNKQAARERLTEIIKQLKDENKEIVVMFDEVTEATNLTEYNQYGIFSYIANNEYVDGITATKTQTKFVTNLNQIYGFDGSLSIIKVSAFKKELEKASGIFTFLTSSLNLNEYLKTRNINFIKQVANNFDFDQIPVMDINIIGQILTSSQNKFEDLSKYLTGTDSVTMYYLGLSDDEQRTVFMEEILKRALVINYLRSFEQDNAYYGLKDKSLENVLSNALFERYTLKKNFNISTDVNLGETFETTAAEIDLKLLEKISQLSQKAFEEKDPQAIDDIIKLIPLYAERNIDFRTATDIDVMEIKNIKGILSAA